MENPGDLVILFRLGERLILTAMVLIVSLVVMVGFWRSVQKLDIADGGKLGFGGSFMFSTPVFVLLAIIGYTYVSLSHPVSFTPGGVEGAGGSKEVAAQDIAAPGAFVGASAGADPDGHELFLAERKVRSLNCLAGSGPLSPRVQDDLATVKLEILAPVWPTAWGDFNAFHDWALGLSTQAPVAAAQEAFAKVHVAC